MVKRKFVVFMEMTSVRFEGCRENEGGAGEVSRVAQKNPL
jgi:hypothetical protein